MSSRRLDVAARRDQLIELGAELFATRSYDDVWVEEIAERAGVSRGLLYHYFPTKRDFYVEVVRAQCAAMTQVTAPDEEPGGSLRAGIDAYLDFVETHANCYLTIHRAGIGADPEIRAIVEAAVTAHAQRIVDALSPGSEPTPALRLAVRAWIGFLQAAALEWLEHRHMEREELRDLLIRAFGGLVGAAQE